MHKTLGAHLAYKQLATQCLSWGGGGGESVQSLESWEGLGAGEDISKHLFPTTHLVQSSSRPMHWTHEAGGAS